MKVNISRQSIYLLFLSVLLLAFVLFFSFLVLIPEGQKYREKRLELKKENMELAKYQEFNDETFERLKKLQSDNRHIITAFRTPFNAERFEKVNKSFFNTLSVSPKVQVDNEEVFSVYEVNTTSKINSPTVFYNFLEAINKSNWIIGINFPINFKRESEMIRSTFTMRVYAADRDSNSTK